MCSVPWTVILDISKDTYSNGEFVVKNIIAPVDKKAAWSTIRELFPHAYIAAIVRGLHEGTVFEDLYPVLSD